jgi:hypothetical protein
MAINCLEIDVLASNSSSKRGLHRHVVLNRASSVLHDTITLFQGFSPALPDLVVRSFAQCVKYLDVNGHRLPRTQSKDGGRQESSFFTLPGGESKSDRVWI